MLSKSLANGEGFFLLAIQSISITDTMMTILYKMFKSDKVKHLLIF